MCGYQREEGWREMEGGGMRYIIKLYKKVKGIITGSGTRKRRIDREGVRWRHTKRGSEKDGIEGRKSERE